MTREPARHLGGLVDALIRKLEKSGYQKGNNVREAWVEAAGEKAAGHAVPAAFKKGEMVVIVDNSSWLYKMTMEKRELIKKFNEKYKGRQKLKNLRFRVGETEQ